MDLNLNDKLKTNEYNKSVSTIEVDTDIYTSMNYFRDLLFSKKKKKVEGTLNCISTQLFLRSLSYKNTKFKDVKSLKASIQISSESTDWTSSLLDLSLHEDNIFTYDEDIILKDLEIDQDSKVEIRVGLFHSKWFQQDLLTTDSIELPGKKFFFGDGDTIQVGNFQFQIVYTSFYKRGFFFSKISPDSIILISRFLGLSDLRNFMMISRSYYQLILKSSYLWQHYPKKSIVLKNLSYLVKKKNFKVNDEGFVYIMNFTPFPFILEGLKKKKDLILSKEILSSFVTIPKSNITKKWNEFEFDETQDDDDMLVLSIPKIDLENRVFSDSLLYSIRKLLYVCFETSDNTEITAFPKSMRFSDYKITFSLSSLKIILFFLENGVSYESIVDDLEQILENFESMLIEIYVNKKFSVSILLLLSLLHNLILKSKEMEEYYSNDDDFGLDSNESDRKNLKLLKFEKIDNFVVKIIEHIRGLTNIQDAMVVTKYIIKRTILRMKKLGVMNINTRDLLPIFDIFNRVMTNLRGYFGFGGGRNSSILDRNSYVLLNFKLLRLIYNYFEEISDVIETKLIPESDNNHICIKEFFSSNFLAKTIRKCCSLLGINILGNGRVIVDVVFKFCVILFKTLFKRRGVEEITKKLEMFGNVDASASIASRIEVNSALMSCGEMFCDIILNIIMKNDDVLGENEKIEFLEICSVVIVDSGDIFYTYFERFLKWISLEHKKSRFEIVSKIEEFCEKSLKICKDQENRLFLKMSEKIVENENALNLKNLEIQNLQRDSANQQNNIQLLTNNITNLQFENSELKKEVSKILLKINRLSVGVSNNASKIERKINL